MSLLPVNLSSHRYATVLNIGTQSRSVAHNVTIHRPSNIASVKCKTGFSHQNTKRIFLPCTAKAVASPTSEGTTKPATAMLELEEKRKGGYWFRKWSTRDITSFFLLGAAHVLAASAPFMYDQGAVNLALGSGVITAACMTLGYHRLLSHRSFKVPKWLEYLWAYCASTAGQRDPIVWVSIHRYHHQYADTELDPHSPREGFWFSHIGWLFHYDYMAAKIQLGESQNEKYANVPDLKNQAFYRFLHDTYFWHVLALAALVYAYGGLPYLAWVMGMRIVVWLHITLVGTSVLHTWGERKWNTNDTSANIGWLAIPTFGDCWHNTHHAFPTSARIGLEWWQLDLAWLVIRSLEAVGLATDVNLPTEEQKKAIAIATESK